MMSTNLQPARHPIRTLLIVAAMATATSFAFSQEARASHFGHGFVHSSSFGHGFHGSTFYGPGTYRSRYGSVRISTEFPEDAQVYVDGAHVGAVDDFDGILQRLSLLPGSYEVEIQLDGDRIFGQQIFVSRGRTYKVRLGVRAAPTAELSSTTEDSSRAARTGYVTDRSRSGAIRVQVKPDEGAAQVYVDGVHAGAVDDFDGVFQRLNLPAGRHDLEIRLAGHRTFQRRVFVSPRRTYTLRHQLEPATGRMAAEKRESAKS